MEHYAVDPDGGIVLVELARRCEISVARAATVEQARVARAAILPGSR